MSEQQAHLPFYTAMKSLEYKMRLAAERTERIHRLIAHDQWAACALIPDEQRRSTQQRRSYWAAQVRRAEAALAGA